MKIKQIWDELENDNSIVNGLLVRRFSGSVLPDVFVALQQPEKMYCIVVSISQNIDIDISAFVNLQEINVSILNGSLHPNKNTLVFKLVNVLHKDIFAVLCEDLVTSISLEQNEKKVVQTLLNRFEKWKSLFTKFASQGLSSEEQRGLYGELYFLRKYLSTYSNFFNVVNAWVGTTKEARDFQYNSWALEVKTTLGNNHQKVHISNERQLDNTHLQALFLYHISLELAQESGETLNQIISSINTILEVDLISKNRFKAKLYEVGYFEHQASLYDNIGYHIRQDNFYLVENEFPRIQEGEIRSGVGDVKYSIILSQCQDYLQTEEQVFQKIST
jgi:hypothetical protein